MAARKFANGTGIDTNSTMRIGRRWKPRDLSWQALHPMASWSELIELRDHPWFLACQYHPEFQSKPNSPHPLFKGFVNACLAHGG